MAAPRLHSAHPFRRPACPDPAGDLDLARTQIEAAGPLRVLVERDTPAVFFRADATTTVRLVQYLWASNAGHPCSLGAVIPWNPAWMPGDAGNDRTVIIHDPATGVTWDLWMVGAAASWPFPNGGLGDAVWNPRNWSAFAKGPTIAVAQTDRYLSAEPWNPSIIGIRGSGGRKIEGLLYLDELEAGKVTGAIGVKTPRTRVGPEYSHPARRSELTTWDLARRGGVITRPLPNRETTPHGTSWALTWTPSDLSRHAAKYAEPGTLDARTIITILDAMATYGIITQETAGEDTGVLSIETDWTPATAARWKALGVNQGGLSRVQRALAAIPATAWVPVLPRGSVSG